MSDMRENLLKENQQLLFDVEVLRARIQIRDFFLRTTVKDIYENVGQVLSIVRMQLAVLNPAGNQAAATELVSSGDLVGQSIRDLRNMTRSFYPDEDILKEDGLVQTLKHTLHILELDCKIKEPSSFVEKDIPAGLKLITFKLLLDVLLSIHDSKACLKSISISQANSAITVSIVYRPAENTSVEKPLTKPAFDSSVKMIGGAYTLKNTTKGDIKILLKVPCKIPLYE